MSSVSTCSLYFLQFAHQEEGVRWRFVTGAVLKETLDHITHWRRPGSFCLTFLHRRLKRKQVCVSTVKESHWVIRNTSYGAEF